MTHIAGDARTRCFAPSYDQDQSAISFGQDLAQAFSDLYSNAAGDADDQLEGLWRRADNAIADLLQELWKRTPADRGEVFANAVAEAVEGRLKKRELRTALAVFRGEA